MTKNTQPATANGPAFIVWFVPERENAPWIRFGALWPTKNGQGYRMNLECLPASPGQMIILPLRASKEEEGA